ncbi:hypothetical protein [Polycladomyces subterraneus]|uniref:Uncharacterized protein n=1 Tax=Polycladomyces subterraneus TaxID=1016997 RepID=A0ABT8IMA1_9BACL|nr:hypothetical protein [Polycladomyces subterraneus]MDN4593919.1 hypothetical protein [Polycladomyces subterraneus]
MEVIFHHPLSQSASVNLDPSKRRTRTEWICQMRLCGSKKGGSILAIDLNPLLCLGGDIMLPKCPHINTTTGATAAGCFLLTHLLFFQYRDGNIVSPKSVGVDTYRHIQVCKSST